jgi:quercetin dioxygenase-like cupin family protein
MNDTFTWNPDLAAAPAYVEDGTVSRVLVNNEFIRATGFALDAGQALTEHAASAPAWIQFLEGEIEFRVGDEVLAARPGAALYLAPGALHSVLAKTRARFLLIILKTK